MTKKHITQDGVILTVSADTIALTCSQRMEQAFVGQLVADVSTALAIEIEKACTSILEDDEIDFCPVIHVSDNYCGYCGKMTSQWAYDPCKCTEFKVKEAPKVVVPEPELTREQRAASRVQQAQYVKPGTACYLCARVPRELVVIKSSGAMICIGCAVEHLGD